MQIRKDMERVTIFSQTVMFMMEITAMENDLAMDFINGKPGIDMLETTLMGNDTARDTSFILMVPNIKVIILLFF